MFCEKTTEVVDVKDVAYGDNSNEKENTEITVVATEDTKMVKQESTMDTIIRAVDHVSPLHVSEMPQYIGIILLLMFVLAYSISFLYLLVDMFANCSEANGCVSCSITVGQTEGASCTNLPVSELSIASGCAKFSLENRYQDVKDIMDTLNGAIQDPQIKNFLPVTLYNSLTEHYKAVELLNQNSEGMLVDPSEEQIENFINNHHLYFGTSDVFSFPVEETTPLDITSSTSNMAKGMALKIIFSYIANGCLVYSALTRGGHTHGMYLPKFLTTEMNYYSNLDGSVNTALKSNVDNSLASSSDADTGHGTTCRKADGSEITLDKNNADHVDYNFFDNSMFAIEVCGCDLKCPITSSGVEIVGSISVADVEVYNTSYAHGLDSYQLAVHANYVQKPSTCKIPSKPFSDTLAAFEFMTIDKADFTAFTNNGEQDINKRPKHCSGASIFTSAPSTLESVFYECCSEKTAVERLSEVSAFSSLIFTFVVIGTTFMFLPFDPSANLKEMCQVSYQQYEEAADAVED